MQNKAKLVDEYLAQYNCAQTVFALHADELGIDKETALKITQGFGGGMKRGATCGAVTGAYMVVGLKHGNNTNQEGLTIDEKIRKFNKLFIQQHGSLNCSDLTGFNIALQEEKEKAREAGVFQKVCPELLKCACNILSEEF